MKRTTAQLKITDIDYLLDTISAQKFYQAQDKLGNDCRGLNPGFTGGTEKELDRIYQMLEELRNEWRYDSAFIYLALMDDIDLSLKH
jgi:hypothetical protein